MIRYYISYIIIFVVWLVRKVLSLNGRSYLVLCAPQLQSSLRWIARIRAYAVFYKAQKTCPAYKKFLDAEGFDDKKKWDWNAVPIMTKENYVKVFSIEDRCYGGTIPNRGTVIDESSGSSGIPNNWVRSIEERDDVKRILQLNYEIIFNNENCILINCFALGPWATGMNVSMSLADVGILKSVGPDAAKLENTLTLFGSKYRYLIFGYPPFIKSWLDNTKLDLSDLKMDAVVGGEGISEKFRDYLLEHFQSIVSSYGASDLEINIGVETELTIAIRRECLKDREMSKDLFGRESPPMIFQFNPADYIIETNSENELLFSLLRFNGAAPKLRYNIHDTGGLYTYRELSAKLTSLGIDIRNLTDLQSSFPLLYVHGRSDLSVAFYGSKIFPSNLEEIISSNSEFSGNINSFQLQKIEGKDLTQHLIIHLEKLKNMKGALPAPEVVSEIVFEELCRINQDFREVTKMFDRSCIQIQIHDYESGVFADRDIRVKNKYIG